MSSTISGGVRQQFGKLGSALSVSLKLPGRTQQLFTGLIDEAELYVFGVIGSAEFAQFGLGIGEIHVRRSAVLKQRDHRARAGSEVRFAGEEIVVRLRQRYAFRLGLSAIVLEHPRQRDASDPHGIFCEKFASSRHVVLSRYKEIRWS
jgi:hypothetical protein